MAQLVTKNGQIIISKGNGKQKGLVTKNGEISTLVPFIPAEVEVTVTGYTHTVMGVAPSNISAVMGIATANISKIKGI